MSTQTVKVSAADVHRVRQERAALWTVDEAEANRILARRNVRVGWPPVGWVAPSSRWVAPAGSVESGSGRQRASDEAERVWGWVCAQRRWEVPVSELRRHFTGVGRVLSVVRLEEVLTELEVLGVVEFVKIRRASAGPRPRGVRLAGWVWALVRAGRVVSVARLREGAAEAVKDLTTQD